ncbi:MAG: hypothetical protein M5U34_45095 [Chloroflexi bacterium]|nr:hypothetical protein [Chloroflexota bacterium]
MPVIKVYHNSNFLDYRGQHTSIVPPIRPVATIEVPEETPGEQALEIAYRQTQHLDDVDGGWWNRESVMLHVRSTSVGDVLADEQGNLFVVESMGFRPYQPRAIRPYHRLAEAYRLLDEALAQAGTGQIVAVAGQTRNTILHVLEAEGYLNGEVPILSWDNVQPGDLVGSPDTGLFRVIARKLRPKWRAKRLLAHIPNAQIWIDSPRTWAVLVPVNEEVQP